MTQQIAIYELVPPLRADDVMPQFDPSLPASPADDESVPLVGETLTPALAQAKLSWMRDGDLSRLEFSRELNEAQNGRIVSKFRGSHFVKATSPQLTLAQAKERATRAGFADLEVYEGIRERTLELMIQRQREIKRLESIVAHADKGIGTQLLLGVTALGTEFVDPINLATMFVPIAGEAKIGYWIAKVGARLGPTLTKLAVRAGVGAYESAVGTALLEPLNRWLHHEVGDDYTMVDSLLNVGLSAAAGGLLRSVGGAGLDVFRSIRLRVGRTIDEYARMMNEALRQIGQGRQVKEILPTMEKSKVMPQSGGNAVGTGLAPQSGGKAGGIRPKARDTGKYPRNSILAMPSSEAGGDRATIDDLMALKEVLLDYYPIESADPNLPETYRVVRDGEVVVYTRSADSPKNVQTFTVQRLGRESEQGLPLSKERGDAGGSVIDDKRRHFIKPPTDLASAISDAVDAKLDELLELADEDPESLLKFTSPDVRGGHKVESEVGDAAHVALSRYAEANPSLHPGFKQTGKDGDVYIVDAFHKSGADIEFKPNTDTGRGRGSTEAKHYKDQLGREAVVLVYDLSPAQWAKVDEINRRITSLRESKTPKLTTGSAGKLGESGSSKQPKKDETPRKSTQASAGPSKKSPSSRKSKDKSKGKTVRMHVEDEPDDRPSPNSCGCP